MPYALDINPSASEVSEAINYLLNNFTQGLTSNPNSGEVKTIFKLAIKPGLDFLAFFSFGSS